PLIECATRKIVFTPSGLGAPTSNLRSAASMLSSASKLSSKKVSWNCARSSSAMESARLRGQLERACQSERLGCTPQRRAAIDPFDQASIPPQIAHERRQ